MKNDSQPVRSRKIFWIKLLLIMALSLVVVFGIYRFVGIRALNQRIQAVRDAGYPADLAELDAWYKMPEGKNAADVYQRAFRAMPSDPDVEGVPIVSTVMDYEPGDPLSDEMASKMEAYLAQFERATELLQEASAIEGCRYLGDYREGFSVLLPQLGPLRRCARMLQVRSLLEADRGEYDLAADRCATIIAMARSLEDEPILISSLVSVSIHSLAYNQIEVLINTGGVSDDRLQALARAIEAADIRRMQRRTMVGERAFGMGAFKDPRMLADVTGYHGVGVGALRTVGLLDIDQSAYLDIMGEYVDYAENPTWPMPESLSGDELVDRIPPICVMTRMIVPAISSAHNAMFRTEARRQTILTAIAVERYRQQHGALPVELKDLVPDYLDAVPTDPFTGNPLRYRIEDGGAIVYSVGADGIDNEGRNRSEFGVSFEDGTDIAFTFGDLQDQYWPIQEDPDAYGYGMGGYGYGYEEEAEAEEDEAEEVEVDGEVVDAPTQEAEESEVVPEESE